MDQIPAPINSQNPTQQSWSRRLMHGSLSSFALRVCGTGMAFASQLVIARHIGEAGYGNYSFALSIVSVAALVAMAGFGNSLLRFSGEYQAKNRLGLLRGVHLVALANGIGASLLVGALLVLVARHATWLSESQRLALSAGEFLVVPLSILGLGQAAVLGFKRPGLGAAVETLIRPSVLLAVFLATVHILREPVDAELAIGMEFIAVAAAGLLAVGVGASDLALRTRGVRTAIQVRTWYRVSFPLLLMTGLQVVFNHTDVIMVGAISTPEATGNYAVASRVSRLVLFGLSSVNAIAAPMIAELYHGGRHAELQHMLRRVAWGIAAFTGVACVVLAVGGHLILSWFGAGYSAAYPALLVLLCGQVVNSLAGPVAYLMTLTGNQDAAARIIAACALLNIASTAGRRPRDGETGAAPAPAIAVAGWHAALVTSVRRRLGFNPTLLGRAET